MLIAGTWAAVYAARRHPGPWTTWFARTLALLIVAAWAGEYVTDVIRGTWSVRYTMPFQLTDAISLSAIVALWTRRPLFVELTYFWSCTASLQAVVTPDLAYTFPNVLYFTYFIYHVGAIMSGIFLVWGLEIFPRPGAVARVFAATLGWAALAGLVDAITGGNYMYLAWKPAHSSLLRVLGPWPWYILSGIAVAFGLLWLVQLATDAVHARIRPVYAHQ